MKASIAFSGPMPSDFTFELKAVYRKYFRKGFIYAVIIHLSIISVYGAVTYIKYFSEEENKKSQQRIINVTLTDLAPPPPINEEEEIPLP